MKNIVPFLMALSFFVSCEPSYCWKCNLYSNENINIIEETTVYCDITERDIVDMIDEQKELGYIYGCSVQPK
jgi:predicted acyltransferase (DUF342 family)